MVENASTADVDKADIPDTKFNDQAFLIHFYEKYAQNTGKKFKNFSQITAQPATLINIINGTGAESLFNIYPGQLSLLVPKIRLYKVVGDSKQERDIELIFNNYYIEPNSINVITKRSGFGVGLTNFSWDDMGTNPGDTGVAFQANLELFAPSLIEFYKEQGEGVSFLDLIRVPPKKFNTLGTYNEKYFRIKVQIGWSIPTDHVKLFSPELLEAIKSSSMTLFLSLTDHEIDLRSDGSVSIKANYMGAIEGKMLSPSSNIFYIDEDITRSIKIHNNQKKSEESLLKETEQRNEEIGGRAGRALDREEKDLKRSIEERQEILANLTKENKAKIYGRLLQNIESNRKLYYVDVEKKVIQDFLSIKDINDKINSLEDLSKDDKDRKKAEAYKQWAEKLKQSTSGGSYKQQSVGDPKGNLSLSEDVKKVVTSKNPKEQEETLDAKLSTASKAKLHNRTRINYMYLGDIIDAALQTLYSNPDSSFSNLQNLRNGTETSKNHPDKDLFNILVGPIELIKEDGTGVLINLADIPISVDLFNNWFVTRVVKPGKETYILRDFISDICSQLVIKAVNFEANSPYVKAPKNRVSFSVFSLGAENDILGPPGSVIVDLESKEAALRKARSDVASNIKQHYMMIYISNYNQHQLRGNVVNDAKKGVYHLLFGADRGLVKNIKFKKVDLQYVRESRIVNESSQQGDIFFVEPYNATVELWGTTAFKPGMMVYIEPKSIGTSASIPKEKRILLGGYFTVTKVNGSIARGTFDTSIELQWEFMGDEDPRGVIGTSDPRAKSSEVSIDSMR